jgi:hypothetical protein
MKLDLIVCHTVPFSISISGVPIVELKTTRLSVKSGYSEDRNIKNSIGLVGTSIRYLFPIHHLF